MPIPDNLRALLEGRDVDYTVIKHDPAYTAQEEAAVTHTPGRNWAKTVVVVLDDKPALAVMPATRRIDPRKLREVTGAHEVDLADEEGFRDLYPDCEPGAMPPFGELYGQPTFVDESLREDEYIIFHAGDHRTAVKLAYAVYEDLAHPIPGFFTKS